MKVLVQPRLQVESWSLYWKESLKTSTQCLEPLELDLPGEGATASELLQAHAQAQSWQPASSLLRLEGFGAPWERVLLAGRELQPGDLLPAAPAAASAEVAAPTGAAYTVVRVVLKADGWKIKQPDDFLTSSSDEEDV
ncbi:hypothetical protein TSOC_002359 [Tetrabaena socialis]|uniref:Uncharacterized protein n=1 Tax=Tetrabaena socialis TaxID=47790 RepID=A0A2J8AE71_9CHLO|nr:hypothetical protein TSOC_002359 [Tetrabaena socialis]|eukprot:PNH10820.1 hypothetical protein TSOC_002359 [Tetrabaena socialis]